MRTARPEPKPTDERPDPFPPRTRVDSPLPCSPTFVNVTEVMMYAIAQKEQLGALLGLSNLALPVRSMRTSSLSDAPLHCPLQASTRRSRRTTSPLKPRLLPHTPVLVLTAPRLPLAGVQVPCVCAGVKPTHRSLAPHQPVALTSAHVRRHVALRCLAEHVDHAAVRLRSRRTDSHSPHARSPYTDRANAARVRRQMLLYMASATAGPQTPHAMG